MKVSFAVACLLGLVAAEEPVWSLGSVQNHRTESDIQKAYGDHSTEKANARPPYQSAVQIDGKNEPVWALTSVLGHQSDSETQIGYAGYSTEKANGRPPYQSTLQMDESESDSDSDSDDDTHAQLSADKMIDEHPTYNAWESVKDGAVDGKYERVITPHFSADSDDIFMRSMIKNYAQEERTKIEVEDDGTKTGGEPTGRFWMTKHLTEKAAAEVLGTHKGLKGDELSAYITTYFPRTWAHYDVNKTGFIGVEVAPQFMRFVASDQTMQL